MQETILDYITNLFKEKHPTYPEPTDNELHEFIFYEMDEVWSGDHDKHRWYTIYWSVGKLPNDRYVKIPCVICDENQGYYDCLDFSKDDILEVYPKQIISTTYVTEKPDDSSPDLILDRNKFAGSYIEII